MAEYAGVLIGGPGAGRQIVHHTPTLVMQEAPSAFGREMAPEGLPEPQQFVYTHKEIEGRGVWIFEGTVAVDELLTAYMNARTDKGDALAPADAPGAKPNRRARITDAYRDLAPDLAKTNDVLNFVNRRCAKRSITHFMDTATEKQIAHLERMLFQ